MTPLVPITIASIYEVHGAKVVLPAKMARCTPDTKLAIIKTAEDVAARGGALILSDLFRSYDMQLGSHMDWKSGRKRAFSPPPGGSLHEAGRALDLDLKSLKMPLKDFWVIAKANGLLPIISTPDPKASEAWHFSCRGSHALVYDYYKAGKGSNFDKPYKAMAASSIVSVGVKVDKFGAGQRDAYVQSALIRLGFSLGNMDGQVGPKTRQALEAVGLGGLAPAEQVAGLDNLLQAKFPGEFFDGTTDSPLPGGPVNVPAQPGPAPLMAASFSATRAEVHNRGKPPVAFLEELVAWGRAAPDEIFAPNIVSDVYTSVRPVLGPWRDIFHRRAVMLEVMRVLAGFESSWKWTEGRDTTNPASNQPDTTEAGAWQVSANSMAFGEDLKALVKARVGSYDGVKFQAAMKSDHLLAMEYIARLLRHTVAHNGPVKNHKIDPWLRRDAVAEFETLLATR